MRLVVAILCGATLGLANFAAAAGPVPSSVVATNKSRFRIPFKFDAAEMQALGAREVRLYVSQDRGATWQHQQSVAPDSAKFQFQAAADGEYWFVVRTLDAQNRLHPEGVAMEPGLKVLVDTTAPKLLLELRQPSAGRVQLAWAATDQALDLTQLRLEYIQPGQPDWQMVTIVPKAMGQTEWSVPREGVVAVRGTIADTAKNSATAEAQLRVAAALNSVPQPESPTSRHPVALPGTGGGNNVAMSPGLPSPVFGGPGLTAPVLDTPPLPDLAQAPLLAPVNSAPSLSQRDADRGLTERGPMIVARPVSQSQPPAVSSPMAGSEFRTLIGGTPSSSSLGDAVGRVRVINGRRFHLGYTVQDIGPSGLGGVEIYATDNGGTNWYRYGEDPDRQSPATVEVPGEGSFGFTVVARSGAGLAADPPQNGQAPAFTLVIDQTAPQIELIGLEQGRGALSSKIAVSWRYQDAHPHELPVQISYSANGQDGWQSVSGWTENSGRYLWNVGPGTPSRFYVRIEARDAAGNTKVVATPQPVLIDLSRPTARILDIDTTP